MDFSKYLGSLASGAQKSYGGLLSGLSAPSLSLSKPAPVPAISTASPSASNPAPTPITSPTSSPAKQQYMSGLTDSSGTTQTGTNNPPADSGSTVPPYLQPGYKSPGQLADEKATANQKPNNADGTPPATPLPTDPMSSYVQYLKTYQDQANTANTALANVQTKQEQAQTDARRGYDAALDTAGGTQGGNQAAATQLDRRNNTNLADIALQESAAARTAGVAQTALGNAKPLQIGDNFYDPASGKLIPNTKANAGFTLSTGQTQYQLDPVSGKYKAIAGSGTNTGTTTPYVVGANPTVDSWVQNINSGKAKLSDITGDPALKSQVSQGLAGSQSSSSTIIDTTKQSLKELQDMVDNNQGFDAAVGIPDILTHPLNWLEAVTTGSQGSQIAGSSAANFDAKTKQVVNDVVLPNLTLLHGLGRVTEKEFQALQSSLTSLSPNLSESQFRTELKNITDRISALSTSSTSSDSSTPNAGTLSADEVSKVTQMRADGLPDNVIEQVLGKPLSFNSVGNTSVSIPQSSRLAYVNNNPGNLKFSSQPGATQGEGGFAKFSSPEAGAKALSDQIQLDASRGLTLSQFVTKFAPPTENMTGQYIKQVASMVGVDPLTPLKNIDLKALTKAVAQKESSTNIA